MSGCEDIGCFWCVTYDEDREEWCAFGGVPCCVIKECAITEQLKEQKQ